jgi:hypothetical protein
MLREARLRPEFAALYPGLEPGAWQDSAALAEQTSWAPETGGPDSEAG